MAAEGIYLVLIVDASGSMLPQREETITALNHFIFEQRKMPGLATISIVQFAWTPSYLFRNADLRSVPVLTSPMYTPNGGTALLDAMGSSIDDAGRYLRGLPEDQRPGKVVVLTLTDGYENSSHGYTKAEVAKKIKHQQDKYAWQFLFMGADMETIKDAQQMGVMVSSTMSWEPQQQGGVMRGMVANNLAVANYRSGQSSNAVYEAFVNPEEKKP